MKRRLISIGVLIVIAFNMEAFKIDRVILASDSNPLYLDFWPLVAQAWTQLTGIRPTLALIADESVSVDETLGDVIRFKPIEGIPTGFQAQVIRLLLPAYFENDVCLISDIDMLPLCKDYFTESVKELETDKFVVYQNYLYEKGGVREKYPMCYNAATGRTFMAVLNISSTADIPHIIRQWYSKGLGWNTDETVLYESLQTWNAHTNCLVKLNHSADGRIDRSYWCYNENALRDLKYVDSHMLRPYQQYKPEIDALVKTLGLEINI